MVEHSAHILLLTEDSGKNAFKVLETLTKKMVQLVHPQTQTNRIRFRQSRLAEGNLRRGRHANSNELVRRIVAGLLQENGFVVHHLDADVRWRDRPSSNTAQFEKRIVSAVKGALRELERDESHLRKLFLVMPYWSMESWLYQNTETALKHCRRDVDHKQFQVWAADRSLLDEVEQPKDNCGLKDAHNLDLASAAFPAEAVYDAHKLFHATVEQLRKCPDLVAALHKTSS